MESVPPSAGSQVSRVPAQRAPSDPAAPTPAPLAPAPQPRRRLRLVLSVVAGVLALLCGGGTALAYVLYDRATAPDRGTPTKVVDGYLRAFFVDRDDVLANQFICSSAGTGLAQIRALRADLQAREQRFGASFTVSWGPLQAHQQGKKAQVEVELIFSVFVKGVSQKERQLWRFTTQLDDKWRLCEADPST